MTNNPTIDGVSRALIVQAYYELDAGTTSIATLAGLKALLDAPAVERQEPVFWKWLDSAYRDGSEGDSQKFTKYNMEVAYHAGSAALQSTIAQLQARIGELESGKPTLPKSYRLVGGVSISGSADGTITIQASSPAPVAVVLPEPATADDFGDESMADGWNSCLDATAALNTPKPAEWHDVAGDDEGVVS